MVDEGNGSRRVAIACQGGGSHTAFTAGALKRILQENDKKFEIIAFSGTSGGAMCALLAWYGLVKHQKDTDTGKEEAIWNLDDFWDRLSASSPLDWFVNEFGNFLNSMPGIVPLPAISPYIWPFWYDLPQKAQDYLRNLLKRYVVFDILEKEYSLSIPELVVGAVNVKTGKFEVFRSNKEYREKEYANNIITADAILASAAESSYFKAMHIGDNVYWDGLFSQNPPISELLRNKPAEYRPHEIWVIQIDPEKRESVPMFMPQIEDRRNELAGNISLNHELSLINDYNKVLEVVKEYLPSESEFWRKYKPVNVRKIELSEDGLTVGSKMNRNPQFIQHMMKYGWRTADKFLKELT